jgi:valyl-tRNA synthetase
MVASGEAPSKCSACGGANIEQDPDVLDTWFSSWLWPVSTLGWPDETKELKLFYPTDALVTAQEIIFFWVARMIMAGLKLKGEVPFRDVYIHGTVRDETGTKMSKSLGNVIDPLEIIEEYGTDALRFSMISITSQGQDVFLSKDKFEFGRNFANKLWNASRYVLMNLDEATLKQEIDRRSLGLADRWILSAFNETIQKVNTDLASYRFNEAAQDIYEFVWHKYCDWYLELAKLSDNKEVTQTVFYVVLKGVLKLLHPFMPFITEEIWKNLPGKKDHKYIMASEWPGCDESLFDETATEEVETMIKIVAAIRNIRAFWNVGVKFNLEVDICFEDGRAANMIKHASHYIERMARCQIRNTGKDLKRPEASVAAAVDKIKLYVPIGGAIDVDKEKARITLKVEELENYLISIEKKLSSRSFADRAPQDIVQKEKEKQAKFGSDLVILKENLQALG